MVDLPAGRQGNCFVPALSRQIFAKIWRRNAGSRTSSPPP